MGDSRLLLLLLVVAAAFGIAAVVLILRRDRHRQEQSPPEERPFAVSTEGETRCPACGMGNLVTDDHCVACGAPLT
jgi:hypothetical protein